MSSSHLQKFVTGAKLIKDFHDCGWLFCKTANNILIGKFFAMKCKAPHLPEIFPQLKLMRPCLCISLFFFFLRDKITCARPQHRKTESQGWGDIKNSERSKEKKSYASKVLYLACHKTIHLCTSLLTLYTRKWEGFIIFVKLQVTRETEKIKHIVALKLPCSISSFAGLEKSGIKVVSLHFR